MDSTQEEWQGIAASLRIALEKRIPDMAAMTPSELRDFIAACDASEVFEMNANARQARTEELARRCARLWVDG